MTAPHADQLIDGYLARLRVAAIDLPSSVREELIEDMRAHIAEARAREPEETDAAVLNILDRLGDPEMLVAEARQRPTPVPSRQSSAWPGLLPVGNPGNCRARPAAVRLGDWRHPALAVTGLENARQGDRQHFFPRGIPRHLHHRRGLWSSCHRRHIERQFLHLVDRFGGQRHPSVHLNAGLGSDWPHPVGRARRHRVVAARDYLCLSRASAAQGSPPASGCDRLAAADGTYDPVASKRQRVAPYGFTLATPKATSAVTT